MLLRLDLCIQIRDTQYTDPMFFFLMIRRPPRSTLDRSSAASDVYKRQDWNCGSLFDEFEGSAGSLDAGKLASAGALANLLAVSYTHLRAHETVLDLVCRLLLEKKKYAYS